MRLHIAWLFAVLFLSFCTSKNDEQIIKLKSAGIDSIKTPDGFSASRIRPIKDKKFKEKINSYPKNYIIEAFYQMPNLQKDYAMSKRVFKSNGEKERYRKDFGIKKLKFLELLKKSSPYDCMVSSCLVKDKHGNEFFIFDRNNDEDLSNDPVLKLRKGFTLYWGDTVQTLSVEGTADVEYFDGSKISNKTIDLKFERLLTNRGFKDKMMVNSRAYGTINFNNKSFTVLLSHLKPCFDYYTYDFMGIDYNNDGKIDLESDYFQQIYLPFTYDNTSYRVSELDPFGRYIKVKKCDPEKTPPIAVGLPAPDFSVTTMDSVQFHLKDYRGHYVLIGFWSCRSANCISQIGEMYKYEKQGLHIINFSFFENFSSRLNDTAKETAEKLGIVNATFKNEVRMLYQVGSEAASILIDKNGNILFIEKYRYNNTIKKLKEIYE